MTLPRELDDAATVAGVCCQMARRPNLSPDEMPSIRVDLDW